MQRIAKFEKVSFDEFRKSFDLPENETPVLLMTLGYPADDSKPMKLHYESKDMTEIVKML